MLGRRATGQQRDDIYLMPREYIDDVGRQFGRGVQDKVAAAHRHAHVGRGSATEGVRRGVHSTTVRRPGGGVEGMAGAAGARPSPFGPIPDGV